MATTSKTLQPTNQVVTLPDMTERPNASVLVDGISKVADAINAVNGKVFDNDGSISDLHPTKASLGCTVRTIRTYTSGATNKPSNEAGTVVYLYNSGTSNWGVAIAYTQSSKMFIAGISADSFGSWEELTQKEPSLVFELKTVELNTTDYLGYYYADFTPTNDLNRWISAVILQSTANSFATVTKVGSSSLRVWGSNSGATVQVLLTFISHTI